ncbi:DEAD/DEAH box helicase [Mariprofundus erugo]|uniref:DEAD/DEAH box helicase n=2 Tax=Mariprofundus erugo TaxID=2528639 RepID=A0A5R9GXQ9_9PROT|nr:DEAD/DEAH box helicase [Mariprofundus erugo]
MSAKEAQARIRINRLLEDAGWRFFDDEIGSANIALEPHVKITRTELDEFGDNFERSSGGYVDFLLLDERGFPLIVLEAKAEDKHPLVGKEQAREYAESQNCQFIILSNGNMHYFWDLNSGNPYVITHFPSPDSIDGYRSNSTDTSALINEPVDDDYIALTQLPDYASQAGWVNESERSAFIEKNRLRFLRAYQKQALQSIQSAVAEGKTRFLFEMATGTGKTLTSAAVIKLFLRTGNARRVLFLVDRLELEDQANKAFNFLLKNDFTSLIYKEQRGDWRKAEIVVTTVQSLMVNNKFERLFNPNDFDLVISDESHRSIGGNARAVFEYFTGFKLGLTATPKDYLKKFDAGKSDDPREFERRMLMDTYRTFGCESGEPTFRYSLLDGVKDGFLINPIVVDARTDITTQLLSDEGYSVTLPISEDEEESKETFYQRDFEKKFFSEPTNRVFCETFLANAMRDPVSGDIGKGLVFAVSQHHAARLTQMLNEIADQMFPGRYKSDFAVQVTSQIKGAQQYTINFANNNLLGSANFIDSYKTSKARICVTVGMMTTGYDCPDILNLALMRPVFSPQDFVQIKGRGTRKHNFLEQLFDDQLKDAVVEPQKLHFKLFDFFANCEYFEEKFDYDEILELPKPRSGGGGGEPPPPPELYDSLDPDAIQEVRETQIGVEGMRIDRMFFKRFEDQVQADSELRQHVDDENWEQAAAELVRKYFHKPKEFFDEEKLSKAAGVDRRVSLREILEKVFGLIDEFKSKDELLEEEFHKFMLDLQPEDAQHISAIKYFFKAYATDGELREIIKEGRFAELHVHPGFTVTDYRAVPEQWRNRVPQYVRDYLPLDRFM